MAALMNSSVISTFSAGWNISGSKNNSLPLDVGNLSFRRINNYLRPHSWGQATALRNPLCLSSPITSGLMGRTGGICPRGSLYLAKQPLPAQTMDGFKLPTSLIPKERFAISGASSGVIPQVTALVFHLNSVWDRLCVLVWISCGLCLAVAHLIIMTVTSFEHLLCSRCHTKH